MSEMLPPKDVNGTATEQKLGLGLGVGGGGGLSRTVP